MTPPEAARASPPIEPIDSQLADALERVGQVLRTRLRAAGAEHGLSPIQAQLLMRLTTVAGPDREPARLASWYDVSRATVSDAVAALRRKGLLAHEAVAGDRRRTRLVPTPRGQKVAGQLAQWDQPVRLEIAALPPAAKAHAHSLLVGLIGRMQQAGLISLARTCTTCRFFRSRDEPTSTDHCTLLDVPLAPESLRLDCPDHQPAA